MIYKLQSSKPKHVLVIFELPSCIWADRIFLAGDFNDWDENCQPMRQSRNGVWRAEIDLPAGQRYEFRYIIDGRWRTDYHADGFTTNRYGTDNSVVVAELPPTQADYPQESSLVHEQNRAVVELEKGQVDNGQRVPWLANPRPLRVIESAA